MEGPRASQDTERRERERRLAATPEGDERAFERVRLASSERRRGQLDLAALALEDALREGDAHDLAGAELAAILALDPGDPGAYRALACFAAILPPPISSPFPLGNIAAATGLMARKAALFRATFRCLARPHVVALAESVRGLVPD